MIAHPKSLAAGVALLLAAGAVMLLQAEPPKITEKNAKKMTTPSPPPRRLPNRNTPCPATKSCGKS